MTYPNTSLFIDGAWVDATDGRTIPVHNPATGQVIGSVAHASIKDLDLALDATQRGFEVWRDQTPAQRSRMMRRAAQLIRERVDDIARLMTLEQGKPLVEARGHAHVVEGVRAVATFHPRFLLTRPSEKARAWSDLLLLMEEPS